MPPWLPACVSPNHDWPLAPATAVGKSLSPLLLSFLALLDRVLSVLPGLVGAWLVGLLLDRASRRRPHTHRPAALSIYAPIVQRAPLRLPPAAPRSALLAASNPLPIRPPTPREPPRPSISNLFARSYHFLLYPPPLDRPLPARLPNLRPPHANPYLWPARRRGPLAPSRAAAAGSAEKESGREGGGEGVFGCVGSKPHPIFRCWGKAGVNRSIARRTKHQRWKDGRHWMPEARNLRLPAADHHPMQTRP